MKDAVLQLFGGGAITSWACRLMRRAVTAAQGVLTPIRRLVRTVGPALAMAVLIGGCGGGASTGAPSGATATPTSAAPSQTSGSSASLTVTVTANDFVFKFSQTSVPAGKVHLVLQNDSKTYQHELWVYPQNQTRLNDYLKAEDAGQTVNAQDYLDGVVAHIGPIDAGKSGSFDVQLAPGQYELSCLLTSSIAGKTMVHYEMGMHGLLTVS